ncbi:MAG: flavin reductase family protein, partial [Oscillospiraceae bacterium]
MSFREIPAGELNARPFHTLDQEWALLSAGDSKNFNTMTVSWGQLGTLWNLPVATVYVRPQRFTREFLEREDRFTLCFFGGHNQSELAFLGSHSGRDEDKLAATPGLSVSFEYGTSAPVFEQAGMIL